MPPRSYARRYDIPEGLIGCHPKRATIDRLEALAYDVWIREGDRKPNRSPKELERMRGLKLELGMPPTWSKKPI